MASFEGLQRSIETGITQGGLPRSDGVVSLAHLAQHPTHVHLQVLQLSSQIAILFGLFCLWGFSFGQQGLDLGH
jgi:hypothetical protein